MPIELRRVLDHMTGHADGRPRRLSWSDYRPLPVARFGTNTVHTVARFDVRRLCTGIADADGKHRLSDVVVMVRLDMSASWRVMGCETPALLHREQGRYDITFLAARDLCRALLELEVDPALTARRSQEEIARELLSEALALTRGARQSCERQLDLYERQISRKLDRGAQRRWDAVISAALCGFHTLQARR